MDHMRISGTEPLSVILSQTCSIKSTLLLNKKKNQCQFWHLHRLVLLTTENVIKVSDVQMGNFLCLVRY